MNHFFNLITDFFNHPFFIIVGGLTVTITILAILYRLICLTLGITPIIFRLGIALWRRKVAIFGNDEIYNSLRSTLIESKLFKSKNIVHIALNNIDKAKDETIFLIDWQTAESSINEIFSARKNHNTAIVIYAKPASIPNEKMSDIANRPNTVVVNFRGRLLNDILTSLITTMS